MVMTTSLCILQFLTPFDARAARKRRSVDFAPLLRIEDMILERTSAETWLVSAILTPTLSHKSVWQELLPIVVELRYLHAVPDPFLCRRIETYRQKTAILRLLEW